MAQCANEKTLRSKCRGLLPGCFFLLFAFSILHCSAQFTDDFSDGNFALNPAWSGDSASWLDTLGKLRSNDTIASAKFYLSTASALAGSAQWEWWDSLQFNTSSANYIDVYLISDSANLKASSFNGYFVRIGNTSDEISLYKRSSAAITEIIDGQDGLLNNSTNVMRIKVTRDTGNLWTLMRDSTGTGNNFVTEGTAADGTFTSGSFFGIAVQQSTSSFFKRHWFDDFYAGPITGDTTAPALLQLTVLSSTQLDLKFSETISQPSAENELNFLVNNSIGNPASSVRDTSDSAMVHLSFSTPFANGVTNTITISGIEDPAGNAMPQINQNFTWLVADTAAFKDVIINEIFADPSPQVGLPNAEFIELYNKSSKTFDLAGWKFSDGSSTGTLGSYILFPDSFLILCPNANTGDYSSFGEVVGLTSFPSLNNSSDNLTLADGNGLMVDAVSYDTSWYQDNVKKDGGYTLELINPGNPCSGAGNWIASADPDGGTPGKSNSMLDTTPDLQAPSLLSVSILSSTQLELAFSETMDSASIASGTYIINNGLSVVSASVPAGNFSLVTLTIAPQIDTAVVYIISASNVTDCSGNLIGTDDSLQFVIGYQPSAGDIIINEIFADPTPQVGLPDAEYVELFNKSSKLLDLSNCDFSGTTFPAGTALQPNGYLILCYGPNASQFTSYGTVAPMSGWSSAFLTNSGKELILSRAGQQIDRVFYDLSWYKDALKDDGGWSLELINPDNPCTSENNWTASVDSAGGTPGKINSVYDITPDNQAPSLVSVNIVSPTQIELSFSETMDSASIASGTYTIDNGLSVVSASVAAGNFSLITLTVSPQIDTAVVYIISAGNVSDCSGNLIGANDSLQFVIGYQPTAGDIIINEIFADPTPQVGLPDAEFVELYNKSNKFLSLGNCDFSGALFPPGTALPPGSYLILTSTANANLFTSYGNVASMGSWSSTFLTNSGKELLLGLGSQVIDEVFYDMGWYKDFVKDDGGWSLERINPDHPCSSADNWKASADASGGTPGKINSVYSIAADTQPPFVSGVSVITINQIAINFSEGMDSASLVTNYTIDNGISVINVQPLEPDFTSVILDLSPALDSATMYSGNIFYVSDCSGNSISNQPFSFGIGVKAGLYDVLINEIYPDPDGSVSSLPEVEFIELYNKTSKVINLNNYKFSDGGSVSTLADVVILPNEYLILCPATNTGEYAPYGSAIGLSSFPSLNNSGDSLTLKDASGNLIHEVNYSDEWYGDEVKKAGGWTLELVDPENPCGESSNWRASNDASGGTPGKVNSVKGTNPDNQPPAILSAYTQDPLTVILYFDETMDSLSAKNASYIINNGISVSAVIVIDKKTVKLTLASALQLNVIYTITASGMSDCIGNSSSGTSAEFALCEPGEKGDIIINEVLFNPRVNGSDFVEVYNNSGKIINLQDWALANIDNDSISNRKIISSVPMVMFPEDYLVLTTDTANIKKEYPLGKPERYRQMVAVPTYNNDSGTVVLINNSNKVTDAFSYTEDMHFALLKEYEGVSLERIDFNRLSTDATNWHSAAEAVGWATPGYKNSQYNPSGGDGSTISVEPEIFSPDNDGFNDVVNINYKFDTPGFVATVIIYDAKGRQIRNIAKNALLGAEGSFSWDGISDSREKARIGIYIIWFETYDLSGKVLQFKKTCVLAGKMN